MPKAHRLKVWPKYFDKVKSAILQNKKRGLQIRDDYKVFRGGGQLGSHISFFNYHDNSQIQEFYGHLPSPPRDGDILVFRMSSGRNAVFILTNISRPGDPRDMFFADGAFIGYDDDKNIKTIVESSGTMKGSNITIS